MTIDEHLAVSLCAGCSLTETRNQLSYPCCLLAGLTSLRLAFLSSSFKVASLHLQNAVLHFKDALAFLQQSSSRQPVKVNCKEARYHGYALKRRSGNDEVLLKQLRCCPTLVPLSIRACCSSFYPAPLCPENSRKRCRALCHRQHQHP